MCGGGVGVRVGGVCVWVCVCFEYYHYLFEDFLR